MIKSFMQTSIMTSIELVILGTTASIPTPKRNHPGIYFRYMARTEHVMLFDAGEGIQRQIFKYGLNFMRISRIFITHWHADHFAGLLTLVETMSLEKRKKPLWIYGPEADEFVDAITSIGYGIKPFEIIPVTLDYEKPGIAYDSDEFSVSYFPARHGVPAVGYRFEEKPRTKIDVSLLEKFGLPKKGRIVGKIKQKGEAEWKGKKITLSQVSRTEAGKSFSYSGDTAYFPALPDFMKADIILSECTYFDESDDRFHMSLQDNLKIFNLSRPKLMILTHFSRRYENQDFPEIPKGMLYAYDGMRVEYDNKILVNGRALPDE